MGGGVGARGRPGAGEEGGGVEEEQMQMRSSRGVASIIGVMRPRRARLSAVPNRRLDEPALSFLIRRPTAALISLVVARARSKSSRCERDVCEIDDVVAARENLFPADPPPPIDIPPYALSLFLLDSSRLANASPGS